MKTLQEQYNLIKKLKVSQNVFLKEAKRQFPDMINNSATYNQAEKILKNRGVINESLGMITLQPINKIESSDLNGDKAPWQTKFENFLSEAGSDALNPIVNNEVEEEINTKEGDEAIKAEEKETTKEVTNTQDRNYDYSPKVDNINNVNAQELLNGVYCEVKNDPKLSLEQAQELVIKNLSEDELYYVKDGQFGVKGLGYKEPKVEENAGETYGGSGYSEKLKEGDDKPQPVEESKVPGLKDLVNEALGGVVTTPHPDSISVQQNKAVMDVVNEDEWQQQAGSQYHKDLYAEEDKEKDLPMDERMHHDSLYKKDDEVEEAREEAIKASQEAAGIEVDEAKKDHDGDGDIDSDDYLAARDKAIKKAMGKKAKKENIETKLSEIGKEGDIVKLEAQLEYLTNYISEKEERVNSINEDDNLKELVDKKKMKEMQKEIKLLEKRKKKMEKMYEKMCGTSRKKEEIVDENE